MTDNQGSADDAPDVPDLLVATGITKRFPGVLALDGVNFHLRAGEVHALCGENGAGKSTLMKILSGLYIPDEGTLYFRGQPCRFGSIQDAQDAGIAMIHQELNLVPDLTVAENIFLAREPRRGPFVDRAKMAAQARGILDRLGVDIEPDAQVKSLSVARQQMVEIAKALSLDADVLIMDEPTSSLTEAETTQLFRVMNELKRQGVGIVYISHRLDEFRHIVDRVTIFRDGKYVATQPFEAISIDEIVRLMVGRDLRDKFPERISVPDDQILLDVRGLTRLPAFRDVSFSLRRGEILGFAGLMGAGRTEVARTIFGAEPAQAGDIILDGRRLDIRSPIDAIAHGIAYLSEDRKFDGLAIGMSVAHNITLAHIHDVSNAFGLIRADREREVARQSVASLDIRTPSVSQPVRLLSGGNQQKVVIGKWLYRESRILFFDEPTRGIDVGAKFAIYKLIDALAARGIGIVVISSELPEILGLTDRVVVFHEGSITGVLDTKTTNQEEIMSYASGIKNSSAA
ncbi:ABC transporter related [Gluconacetobacter diazotrophicus PA1 5]|uniref:Sugar ABC transporter ATP-binding protein n=1 Tax=Gluconacetobacter diazotrophicus TaxID=33996 RepID=A0A7W4NHH2_GLUDI|nr:sugar ABC transporter ATP-binding protein [Gluconacetobacter diazotrophicus]ACI50663.1 ABC transporter related [Gluconacetobacter diazotrophicus PA1 5]MBB2157827.1 sugar ABC transporter ATP-binding protein [Gluconacetobacter diazotrophicus]TWB09495.1 monosaccharide ABC transporter ATP-binding protein (CUT2 family) [Gluconacetobacter diazotrophicus]